MTDAQRDDLVGLKGLFGKHGEGSWTGLNLYRRLHESRDAFTESEWTQVERWHAIAHRLHNQYVHSSPWAIEKTFQGVSDGMATFATGPSDHWVPEALFAGAWTISVTVLLILRHFQVPDADSFWRSCNHQHALIRPLNPDEVEGVGRNDLCPCGSGEKFKRCHGA